MQLVKGLNGDRERRIKTTIVLLELLSSLRLTLKISGFGDALPTALGHSYFYFCFSSHFSPKSYAPNRKKNNFPPKNNPNTLTQHLVTGTQKYRLLFY